jgi:hypothetical protein
MKESLKLKIGVVEINAEKSCDTQINKKPLKK